MHMQIHRHIHIHMHIHCYIYMILDQVDPFIASEHTAAEAGKHLGRRWPHAFLRCRKLQKFARAVTPLGYLEMGGRSKRFFNLSTFKSAPNVRGLSFFPRTCACATTAGFNNPTFRPSRATNHRKHMVNGNFPGSSFFRLSLL